MQRALFSTPLSREMLQAISSGSCFQTCSFQPTLSFPQRERSIFKPALRSSMYREFSSRLDQAPRSCPQVQMPLHAASFASTANEQLAAHRAPSSS